MSQTCLHECNVHSPYIGPLEAVSLLPGGVIHASHQGVEHTLCGYYIPATTDPVFCGWWNNHTRRCKHCTVQEHKKGLTNHE